MFSAPNKGVILDLLDSQTAALEAISNGRLAAWIATSAFAEAFSFKFMVSPSGREDQAFELFVTRSRAGQMPCTVENYHAEPRKSGPIKTLNELKAHLTGLFNHSRTQEILQILADEAEPPSKAPDWAPATVARIEPTAFSADDPSIPDKLVKLRLRDLVGFLLQKDVGKLLGDPDAVDTNFTLLNDDQYLMYVDFAAPIGIPISASEIAQLQTSIRAAMSDWEADDRLTSPAGSHPHGRADD
jgi:hypothetical protein